MRAGFPGAMRASIRGQFLPTRLPNLKLWLDATDNSTLTIDTGVSVWGDKSGNGNHVTQGTGANQPATGVTTQNGKNVIDFATNKSLGMPNGLLSIPGAANTTFVVAKRNVDSGTQVMLIYEELAGNFRAGTFFASAAGTITYRNDTGSGINLNATSITTTDFNMYRGSFNGTTGQTFSVNGAAPLTNTGGSAESGATLGTIGSGNSALPLTGSIAEMLIYDRELSDPEILRVEEYLSEKWGLP